MAFNFFVLPNYLSMPLRTLTGALIQMTGNPPLVLLYILDPTLLLGCPRNKRLIVSRSSTKSEYCNIVVALAELKWIQNLLTKLHLLSTTPTIRCDNLDAVLLAPIPLCTLKPSILGWTFTLLGMLFNKNNCTCFMFLQLFKLLIYSQSLPPLILFT